MEHRGNHRIHPTDTRSRLGPLVGPEGFFAPLASEFKHFPRSCVRDQYLAMGLYHIAGAVSFLNNDAKVVREDVT